MALMEGTDGVFDVVVERRIVFTRSREGRFPGLDELWRFLKTARPQFEKKRRNA